MVQARVSLIWRLQGSTLLGTRGLACRRHERASAPVGVGMMCAMSASAANADAFYAEVLGNGQVWTIRDDDGFLAPEADGVRAMPFWSTKNRAEKVIQGVDAYHGLGLVALSLDEWRTRWLPGLRRDGFLVGVNWSGARATGYDLTPDEVERNLNARERY